MNKFKVISEFTPKGDQPAAIKKLKNGIDNNIDFQTINFIPFQIYDEILSFNFFNSSRFEIIKITSSLISERPIWGWGKSLYPNF